MIRADIDSRLLVERLCAGQRPKELAAELGMSLAAVYARLYRWRERSGAPTLLAAVARERRTRGEIREH